MDKIDGKRYLSMVCCGADRLNASRKTINDLNVFPIPDGDTGDNMYMTLEAGCRAAPPRTSSRYFLPLRSSIYFLALNCFWK